MLRMALSIATGVFCAMVATSPVIADGTVSVSSCELRASREGARGVVGLENSSGSGLPTTVVVEIINPSGKVLSEASAQATPPPGGSEVSIPWPDLANLDEHSRRILPWQRLRCRLSDSSESQVVGVAQGCPDAPAVEVLSLFGGDRGSRIPVTVRSVHAATGDPLSGRQVELSLENDDGEVLWSQEVQTDSGGRAETMMPIPADAIDQELQIKVRAEWGPFLDLQQEEIGVRSERFASLATDRKMYRPGQTLRFRAIVFSPAHAALPGLPVQLRILDPNEDPVMTEKLVTSEFGIAHGSWAIPDDASHGYYSVELVGDDDEEALQYVSFQVAEYELPTFTASVKADRDFYLPGQRAVISTKVSTLAGQPLSKAVVEVVEASGQTWWWRPQPLVDEQIIGSCTTDLSGGCKVEMSLEDLHSDLSLVFPFEDREVLVQITEPATGRVAYRSLDLRATKEPIHVYLRDSLYNRPGIPLIFLVSTFTADGRPEPCVVEVYRSVNDEPGELLTRTETNRFGLAELSLAYDEEEPIKEVYLVATASTGETGHGEGWIWETTAPVLRVIPDRVFHRAGDAIHVRFESNVEHSMARCEVWVGGQFLFKRPVALEDGIGELDIAYEDRFRGEVSLEAFLEPQLGGESEMSGGTATVLYPGEKDLNLTLEVTPAETDPGMPVTARLRVADSTGTEHRASVGIAVTDEAVEALLADLGEPSAVASFARQSEATLYEWEDSFAGITRRDLADFDPKDPPEDLETVARYLLDWGDTWRMVLSTDAAKQLNALYLPQMRFDIARLVGKCGKQAGAPCPVTADDLSRLLKEKLSGKTRDPWGSEYRTEIETTGKTRKARVISNGPDRIPETADDLVAYMQDWRWFAPIGLRLDKALENAHPNTGLWPTTPDDVVRIAQDAGIDWDTLRDPWDRPVTVETTLNGHRIIIDIMSPGPDGILSERPRKNSDDITAWTVVLDTFEPTIRWIKDALEITDAMGMATPDTATKLREILAKSDLPDSGLIDLHGNPYALEVEVAPVWEDRYQHNKDSFEVKPITAEKIVVTVTSNGPDGRRGTSDDVRVARLEGRPLAIEDVETRVPKPGDFELDAKVGAISGVVRTRADGLPLPGATVKAGTNDGETVNSTVSNAYGRFTLVLAPGEYTITCSALGFVAVVKEGITVEGWKITVLDAELEPEMFSGEVLCTAEAPKIETTQTCSALVFDDDKSEPDLGKPARQPRPFSTPRVRHDFPETLIWEPDLIVDGATDFRFDLADAVTTWRVQAVASTADGRFAIADGEVVASLPFYVQLERPEVLTVGDSLALPALVRNFTDEAEKVNLHLKADAGLEIEKDRKRLRVDAGRSNWAEFEVHARNAVERLTLQLEGVTDGRGDAVEHEIEIKPPAEERREISAALVRDHARLVVEIPDSALPGSLRSKIRILPSLSSQVMQSIKGLLSRPAGCAEQITSTAFVHKMFLELAGTEYPDTAKVAESRRAIEEAQTQLGTLVTTDGGVPFWFGGKPRVALSAHVLRFLAALDGWEARDLEGRLATWLIEQVREDGGWADSFRDDTRLDVQLTAFVTRALAEASDELSDKEALVLARALTLLGRKVGRFGEPHALASYVLACVAAGREGDATAAATRLAAAVRAEGPSCYWHVGANTPLDGWGLPGRIETTALAIQALAAVDREQYGDQIDCGTRFLMTHKDPFSGWYSTQSTVASLEALVAAGLGKGRAGGELRVMADGREVRRIEIPVDEQSMIPITLTLDDVPGLGAIDLVRTGGDALLSAELVSSFYIPWTEPRPGDPNLGFEVTFDAAALTVGKETSCRVHAARLAHQGYGMLLAEVGLPPGAVVNRPALQRQLGNRFEIRPDRVVLYLMARAGGTDIEIPFTPRFSGEVMSSPSLLYDYYNPLARVAIEPVKFTISPGKRR